MKKHVKLWMDSRGFAGEDESHMCEWCWAEVAVDVHHIAARGMGGRKGADVIENLIGLGRRCHDKAERGQISKDELFERVRFILEVLERKRKRLQPRGMKEEEHEHSNRKTA